LRRSRPRSRRLRSRRIPAPAAGKPADSDANDSSGRHKLLKDNGTESRPEAQHGSDARAVEKMRLLLRRQVHGALHFDHVMIWRRHNTTISTRRPSTLAVLPDAGRPQLAEATLDITADLNASTREYVRRLAEVQRSWQMIALHDVSSGTNSGVEVATARRGSSVPASAD
jgi:hypothetical protein